MAGHIAEAYALWEDNQGKQAGRVIYEHLRQNERPAWAAEILRVVLKRVPGHPEAEEVIRLASDSDTWHLARPQFSRIRQVTLRTTEQLPLNCLLLAENVAKVVYNAIAPSAPFDALAPSVLFDADSGWAVVSCARIITQIIDDPPFTAKVWAAIIQSSQTGAYDTTP